VTRWPTRNFRPEPELYDAARAKAEAAGVNMNQLLQAMLMEFRDSPTERLSALRANLAAIAAETPPRGRPKKTPPAEADGV
jgi:hypothetical protein